MLLTILVHAGQKRSNFVLSEVVVSVGVDGGYDQIYQVPLCSLHSAQTTQDVDSSVQILPLLAKSVLSLPVSVNYLI